MTLDVYVRTRAKTGQSQCGDAFWYGEHGGVLWTMVVDGLGSGAEAAASSHAAVESVRRSMALLTEPASAHVLEQMVWSCDQALRGTRGAALGMAMLDLSKREGHFAGVGNVEMRVVGVSRIHPVPAAGIVGTGLRRVRVERFAYQAGDLVLMHSDGISSRFDLDLAPPGALSALGDRLVREHGKSHDDVTLLLMRQMHA